MKQYIPNKDSKLEAYPHDDDEYDHKPPSCWNRICCICCPCLPMYLKCVCCIGLFLGLIIIGVLGSIVALFRVPSVDFNGLVDDPQGRQKFQMDESLGTLAFKINMGFNIGIVNPNIEKVYFESIKAIAYYPTDKKNAIGGGIIKDLNIDSHSITNFTFPFQIRYNPNEDSNGMLLDIVNKCGLTGYPIEDITVNYDLTPTVKVFGYPLSVTIPRQLNFPCPIENGQLGLR
ncbi:unnamed protein product [Cunninghamella blakesleeana]